MNSTNHKLSIGTKVDGTWWLPSHPDRKIPGTLVFEPGEKLSLQLYGCFADDKGSLGLEPRLDPSIINGVSVEGKLFTLLYCLRTDIRWNYSYNCGRISYSPRFAFSGALFKSAEEIKIKTCYLGLNFLEDWIGWTPFKNQSPRFHKDGKSSLNVDFDAEEFFSARIESLDAEVTVGDSIRTAETHDRLRSLSYERKAFFKIVPETQRDFHWYLEVVRGIRDLMYLFSGVIFDITSINFIAENVDAGLKRFEGGEITKSSLLYIQEVFHKKNPVPSYLFPFSRGILTASELKTAMENWFKIRDNFRNALDLFFGSVRIAEYDSPTKFLSFMQTLEAYHRTLRDGRYISNEDYMTLESVLVAAIPDETDKDLHISLRSRLRYGNEYSLRKRIKLLLASLEDDCRSLITQDISGFIKRIIDTRNYLTHYSDELKTGVLAGANLSNTNLQLRLLILILFLKEVGFTEEKIVDRLKEKNHLSVFNVYEVTYTPTENMSR